MKLNWKLKRNGDEVAGPIRVATTDDPCEAYRYAVFVGWPVVRLCRSRAQAKRAAQRIADTILRNVGVKP